MTWFRHQTFPTSFWMRLGCFPIKTAQKSRGQNFKTLATKTELATKTIKLGSHANQLKMTWFRHQNFPTSFWVHLGCFPIKMAQKPQGQNFKTLGTKTELATKRIKLGSHANQLKMTWFCYQTF